MISGECQCAEQCGRPAKYPGPPGIVYSEACARRWRRAGSPPGGAPAPRSAITGTCECASWCGRPATGYGPGGMILAKACHRRWRTAGRPARPIPAPQPQQPPREPPPPPVPDWDEPDPAEVAARWAWADPQLRRERAVPAAAALVRCVQAKDRAGVEIVTSKCTDWGAMMVVLAEVADPVKVAGLAGAAREGKAA